MTAKKIYLVILFTLFPMNIHLWAQAAFDQKNMLHKTEPIQIVSDKMEAFNEKKIVVFSGNAVATQGDIKLKTDRLSFYYKKTNEKKEKIGKLEVEATGDLDRIEAKGHVVITQKEIAATGDEAVYYQDNARIVMTGNPVLQEGKNVIKGCRVIIFINENRGKVEQCDSENSGRVTAIIHQQGKK
jgi:lipopolysaccharide export system protein LptA